MDKFQLKTEQKKYAEHRKTRKQFLKEQVENAGLCKSVMKEIMTMHE